MVSIIENGCNTDLLKEKVKEYCSEKVDAWILGCTHFPVIRPFLNNVDVYDSNQVVVDLFKDNEINGNGEILILTTGDEEKMKKDISILLNKVYNVRKIDLKNNY